MKKKKYLSFLIVLSITFIAAFLFYYLDSPAKNTDPSNKINISEKKVESTITLAIDYGDGEKKVYDTKATEGTVYDLLEWVAEENNIELSSESYDFGVFVKSINNLESTQDMAWIYFVNDESANVGADQYELKPGDQVEWKYIKPSF